MKRYIAASMPKKKILSKVDGISVPMITHLCKLYSFRYDEYLEHWEREVWSMLNQLPTRKGKNKPPKFEDVYNAILSERNVNSFNFICEIACDEEQNLVCTNYDYSSCFDFVDAYVTWAIERIEDFGFITLKQVKDKINELLEIHN